MRSRGDLHELVFVQDPELATFQGVFKSSPHLKEYSMSDLFSKHPTKAHHWKHEGRVDDMIVFKSGWNFNPTIHEQLITSHPVVNNCVLIGTGRNIPAAIVELRSEFYTEEENKKQELLVALAPKIDEANSYADTTGQLRRDCIIFAKKEKPFAIAGKGTVQRKATVTMYETEIDQLYNSVGRQGVSVSP